MIEHCGAERIACVCRELTKIHEEIIPDTLENLVKYYDVEKKVRGEIVLIVMGNSDLWNQKCKIQNLKVLVIN